MKILNKVTPIIVKPKDIQAGQFGIILSGTYKDDIVFRAIHDLINLSNSDYWSTVEILSFDVEILPKGTTLEI